MPQIRGFPSRLSSRPVGVAENLYGVPDGEVGTELGKMRAELGKASDVTGSQHLCASCQDRPGFLLAQGGGDLGLVKVEGTGAAAAEVGIRQLTQLDAGNGAQHIARLAADVLGLREVASVVIRDALRSAGAGRQFAQAEPGEEDGDIDDPLAESFGASLIGRATQY